MAVPAAKGIFRDRIDPGLSRNRQSGVIGNGWIVVGKWGLGETASTVAPIAVLLKIISD